ncbi:MAG TPA: tetratricopeptide repeat protein, partial [Bacteroidia bacterium]|nr:tetratricopeptide repeat protein [Bacteroidia bacterium]
MNHRIIITLILAVFVFRMNAQQVPLQPKDGYKNTRNGNKFFKKENYTDAEKYYTDAVQTDTNKTVANYNLGNALYKQKKYEQASQAYSNATSGTNPDSLSKSWHNLGNS